MGDNYIIPAHLKGNLRRRSRWGTDDLTHFQINLNASDLFASEPWVEKLNQSVLEAVMRDLPEDGKEEPTLQELQRRVEDWDDSAADVGESFSILGHTSLTLGTAGTLGVIALVVILCWRKGGRARAVRAPLPAEEVSAMGRLQAERDAGLALRGRIDAMEGEQRTLRERMQGLEGIEERLTSLRREVDNLARMI